MSLPRTTKYLTFWGSALPVGYVPPAVLSSQTQNCSTHHRSLVTVLWGLWLKYIHCFNHWSSYTVQQRKAEEEHSNRLPWPSKVTNWFFYTSFQIILFLVFFIVSTWISCCYNADNFKMRVKSGSSIKEKFSLPWDLFHCLFWFWIIYDL